MHVTGNDAGRASRLCLRALGRYVSSCMQSIGLMVTNPVWQATLRTGPPLPFAQTAWRLCTRFPPGSQRDCVVAGVDNLGNFDRLDVGRARSFCSIVGRQLRGSCFRQIGVDLERQTKDEAVRRTRCESLPSRYVPDCLEGARSSSRLP
jgi:hypothetical protein